jgi:DNA-directed RNA polymerase specialized sigma24 family protein
MNLMAEECPRSEPEKIADDAWKQLRTALILFFSHHGIVNPDDLAQDTLARVIDWLGKGNRIAGDNGIRKLCYGFARNVLREAKDPRVRQMEQLKGDVAAPVQKTLGLNSNDARIYVEELLGLLSREDREIILAAERTTPVQLAKEFNIPVAILSVRVFRARERLRKLASSRKSSSERL